jgi:hypothetical protein
MNASGGSLKLDTAFEILGLAIVTFNGAAPHVSDTGRAEVSQRMLVLSTISTAAVNCVTWAGVDDFHFNVWNFWAADALWVGVASRVGLGEGRKRDGRQGSVLLIVPLSRAWNVLLHWKALAECVAPMETHWEFLTVWTLVRVRWHWWVIQAEAWFALLGGAHGNAVPLLADSDLFGDTTVRVIARDTVLLANPLQEAIHNLKGDPLPLAVTLQLHDLLDCTVVLRSGLEVVVVVSVQDLADLQGVGASLLLEL